MGSPQSSCINVRIVELNSLSEILVGRRCTRCRSRHANRMQEHGKRIELPCEGSSQPTRGVGASAA